MGSVLRVALPAAFVFVFAILGSTLHARAAVEYCPTSVTMSPLGTADSANTFAATFYGGSLRLVSGSVAVRTDRGWFSFPFNDRQLEQTSKTYRDNAGTFYISDYESPALYVHFAKSVRVEYAYVNLAKGVNDASFVWDAKGLVSCQSADDRRIIGTATTAGEPLGSFIEDLNPRATPSSVPFGSRVVEAKPATAPAPVNCAQPFGDATIAQQVVPQYPENARGKSGESIVAVALDGQGQVGDAWVWRSSGVYPLDAVAVAAARQSLYTPKRAFCQDVPSVYYIVDEFKRK